jgi:hypothetical protein
MVDLSNIRRWMEFKDQIGTSIRTEIKSSVINKPKSETTPEGWIQRKPERYNTESFSVLTQSMKDNAGIMGSTYNSLPQATAVYPCREDFFLLPTGSLTFLG